MSGLKECEFRPTDFKALALEACDAARASVAVAGGQLASLQATLASGGELGGFREIERAVTATLVRAEAMLRATTAALAEGQPAESELPALNDQAQQLQREIQRLGAQIAAGLENAGEAVQLRALGATIEDAAGDLARWDAAQLEQIRRDLTRLAEQAKHDASKGRVDPTLGSSRAALKARVAEFREDVAQRTSLHLRREDFLATFVRICQQRSWLYELDKEADRNREIILRVRTYVHGDLLVRLPLAGPVLSTRQEETVEIATSTPEPACGRAIREIEKQLLPEGYEVRFRFAETGRPVTKDAEKKSLPPPIHTSRPKPMSRNAERLQLNVAHVADAVWSTGPGRMLTVWVQGCPLRCPGCINPDFLEVRPRQAATPEKVARLLRPEHDGICFSGGEPFLQAEPLAELARLARTQGRAVVSYSGFTLEELRAGSLPHASGLLGELDILIDGPFRRELAAPLPWRGSRNQRVHFLTGRFTDAVLEHGATNDLAIGPDGFRVVGTRGEAVRILLEGLREAGWDFRPAAPATRPPVPSSPPTLS